MHFRSIVIASMALALTACTTTSIGPKNEIENRWVGQSAGVFFAQFGPPIADVASGSSTLYTWKGGYKTARIPAKYAEGTDNARGKQIAAARTASLSCTVQLTVSSEYKIQSVRTISDRQGETSASYCAEFLAAQ